METTTTALTAWNFKIPLPYSSATIVNRLAVEEFDFVHERLLVEGTIEPSQIAAAELEFRKFVFLTTSVDGPMAMISPAVDEIWHQFILFTKEYAQFCSRTVGYFVDHLPDTHSTPVPEEAGENFRAQYRKFFGELPEIWFEGMNEETRTYYLSDKLAGKPPTAWSGWTPRRKGRSDRLFRRLTMLGMA